MRHIEGFVCIERHTRPVFARMHGKNMGRGTGALESFSTNGLTPFPTLEEGMAGYSELISRKQYLGFDHARISLIKLEIAQNNEEIEGLRRQRQSRFVVLQFIPEFNESILFGRLNEKGLQNGYTGTPFENNGLKPLRDFDSAYFRAYQIRRQAGTPVQIATFYLRYIPLGKY